MSRSGQVRLRKVRVRVRSRSENSKLKDLDLSYAIHFGFAPTHSNLFLTNYNSELISHNSFQI